MSDSEPVSSIRNLGPRSVELYARAGITSAHELRSLGADEAYKRLIVSGVRPHFIGYYAMALGLQGRPWNDLDPLEKADLRNRFDALVEEVRSSSDNVLARELDAVGVRL